MQNLDDLLRRLGAVAAEPHLDDGIEPVAEKLNMIIHVAVVIGRRVFGDGGAWQQTMNLATGGVVYLIILILAAQLLRSSAKQ